MTQTPRKPSYGAACNGCGLCCTATPCVLADAFVRGAEIGQACPALELEDGRYWCGLYRHPGQYVEPRLWAVLAEVEPRFKASVGWDLFIGKCDAGAPGGVGVDEFLNMTAAEYTAHAIKTGLTWEECE